MKVLHPVLQRKLLEFRQRHANNVITEQQIIDEINWHASTLLTDKLYEANLISYDEYVALNELNWQSFKAFFKELNCCGQQNMMPETNEKNECFSLRYIIV